MYLSAFAPDSPSAPAHQAWMRCLSVMRLASRGRTTRCVRPLEDFVGACGPLALAIHKAGSRLAGTGAGLRTCLPAEPCLAPDPVWLAMPGVAGSPTLARFP